MARYWVGGTGTWNGSDTSHWSATSGGASGASVPTASDDVFLDANSGTGTITTATPSNTATCRNFDCTGYTGTLTCTGQLLINPTAGGTVTYGSGMTLTNGTSESIAISVASGANCTMTANGKTLPLYNFTGSSTGGTTFADAVNCSNQLTHTSGTINAPSLTLSWGKFSSSNTNTRTLTITNSAITVGGTGTTWDCATSTNQTVNASGSTITFTGASATVQMNSTKTYGDLLFTGSASPALGASGLTCANLTRTGTAVKTDGFLLSTGTYTVTGTCTLGGHTTQGANRLIVQSNVVGTQRTITAGAYVITGDVDFTGINLAYSGAASWTNSGNAYIGDGLGNDGAVTTNATAAVDQTRIGKGTLTGHYLSLPGVAGNSASAPDIAGYTGSGIIRGALRLALADWSPSATMTLFCHWQSSGTSRGWLLDLNATGIFKFYVSFAGTANDVDIVIGNPGFVDGQTYWIGYEYNTGTGDFAFYTAPDNASMPTIWSGWTSFFSSTVSAGTPFNSDQSIEIGTRGDGSTNPTKGNFYRALFYTDTTTLQFDADFTAESNGTTSFTEDSSNAATVTINSTGTAGGTYSDNLWTSRQPLPQDDVTVTAAAGGTITADMPRIGTDIDFTGFAGTLANSITITLYGSLNIASGMTYSPTSTVFAGRSSHTITSNGKSIPGGSTGVTIAAPGGTYTLADAATWSANLVVANGVFNTANFNCQFNLITSNSGLTRSLLFGTSTITLIRTSAGDVVTITATGLTLDATQATFVIGTASANTRNFGGGALNYGKLQYTVTGVSGAGGYGTLTIASNNTFKDLEIGPGRVVQTTSTGTVNIGNAPALNPVVGQGYYFFPGLAAATATTPDSVPLSITGDIDIRARIAPTDWTPAANNFILSKNPVGNRSYSMYVQTTGRLVADFSVDGTNLTSATSSASPTITDGDVLWVRATRTSADGVVKFYTADGSIATPVAADFTQLGTDQSTTSGSIANSNQQLEIGGHSLGSPLMGKYYRLQIRDGIDGTLAFDADFTNRDITTSNWLDTAKTQFTESSANAATITINGIAQVGDGRISLGGITAASASTLSKGTTDAYNNVFGYLGSSVTHNTDNVQLPGTSGNYIFAHDSLALSITGDIDLRAKVALDDWMPTSVEPGLVGKWSGSTQRSHALVISTTGRAKLYLTTDGATLVSASSSVVTGVTNGTVKWVRATWRQSDGRVQFFLSDDGVNWTQLGTDQAIAIASIFDSTSALELGATGGGTATLWSGKFYQAKVLDGIDGTVVAHFNAETEVNRPTAIPYNYLSIKDSTARGRGTWYAGMQSADVSGNTGWVFTGAVWPRRPQGTLRQAESLRQVDTVRQVETTRQT